MRFRRSLTAAALAVGACAGSVSLAGPASANFTCSTNLGRHDANSVCGGDGSYHQFRIMIDCYDQLRDSHGIFRGNWANPGSRSSAACSPTSLVVVDYWHEFR
jgi:hypothetical protein